MSAKSLIKKVSLATMAGVTTFALVACSPSEDSTDGAGSSVSSEDSQSSKDSQDDNKDADNATQVGNVVSSYFTKAFTTELAGGVDGLVTLQEELVAVSGEEAFASDNPYSTLGELSTDDLNAMIESTKKYTDSSQYLYYGDKDGVKLVNELLGNVVTLTFNSIIGAEFVGSNLEVTVDESKIVVDGDTATVPSDALGLKSDEEVIDEWPFGIDIKAVKDGDTWKIDSETLISALLEPVDDTQTTEAQ